MVTYINELNQCLNLMLNPVPLMGKQHPDEIAHVGILALYCILIVTHEY